MFCSYYLFSSVSHGHGVKLSKKPLSIYKKKNIYIYISYISSNLADHPCENCILLQRGEIFNGIGLYLNVLNQFAYAFWETYM